MHTKLFIIGLKKMGGEELTLKKILNGYTCSTFY